MFINITILLCVLGLISCVVVLSSSLRKRHIPALNVKLSETPDHRRANSRSTGRSIPCHDPATGSLLGHAEVMGADQVNTKIQTAQQAAQVWRHSSFEQRRQLIRIILKYVVEHQTDICRVATLDSGKPLVDAAFGEVMVTCEKAVWLLQQGERWLRPERRSAGRMMFYKSAWVEYRPVGVVGAIVPWNYPFHNIFNPLMAAVFAGNSIVIKVSEHASWSALQYGAIIEAALEAAGAPQGLVQLVTGYAEAGAALAAGPINHLIFVGSTGVGRQVMAAAAQRLTPLTLELGGKDPFIICQDADLHQAVPTVLRGTFQSSGQNCAGVERVLVHRDVHDQVVDQVLQVVRSMRQGHGAGEAVVDTGAMCLPGLSDKVAALVQEAQRQGAQVHTGGQSLRSPAAHPKGDFFPPTVITGVTPAMDIWREEVFGPIMCISSFSSDDQAVALANDCAFGLGAAVFSCSQARARRIAAQLQAGMVSINDFAATYMCQSLPFGGVKDSGFGRFAGVEGLRALCHPVAVCQDRLPFLIRTDIPPMLRYPVDSNALMFVSGLVSMFYSPELQGKATGLMHILSAITKRPSSRTKCA